MQILRSVIGPKGDAQIAPLAFAIGFFPPVAWQLVRQSLKTVSGLFLPATDSQLPLSELDGLNVWHQTRFEEEDIEIIPNMATADIVDLLLNTRIPPDRIIDWIDQAILYTHLPEEQTAHYREKLRQQGIRTASEFLYAYERSGCQNDTARFEAILPSERDGRSPVRGLAMALFTNPNLCLIQAWRGLAIGSEDVALIPPHQDTSSPSASHAYARDGKQSAQLPLTQPASTAVA